jgi:three-Cys-motif partner protein
MSKNMQKDIITIAKPHTIQKFEIIENYVADWAWNILGFKGVDGKSESKGIVYIDCMSNCGVYKDEHGNRIEGTAIRVAKRLNAIIEHFPGKDAVLIFNDIDERRTALLEQEIEKLQLKNITVSCNSGDCNVFLKGLDLSSFNRTHNTLLLYDPYDASIDWDAVSRYLNRWGEVIINHMISDTTRGITQAKKIEVKTKYVETYQKDIDEIINMATDRDKLNDTIISIITKQTTKDSKQYIASFPFYNRTNGLVYNLIFCTFSVKGLILFKKSCWKTFNDRSSSKNTHGKEDIITFFDNGNTGAVTDQDCYNVHDVAKYIYEKYHSRKEVPLKVIYFDLDRHPVFPSDGYKTDIKKELIEIYNVSFPRGQDKAVFND